MTCTHIFCTFDVVICGIRNKSTRCVNCGKKMTEYDNVNKPKHYNYHPSGVECIEITRHMTFNLGNVVKYIWRSGLKDANPTIQELEKAAWYLNDEIQKMKKEQQNVKPAP